jgi:hypothetical protein
MLSAVKSADPACGHRRKADVPLTAGTSPKVCGKCDFWFAAASRQRVCNACVPPHRRTLRVIADQGKCIIKKQGGTEAHPGFDGDVNPLVTGPPEVPEAFSYEDLCRLWSRRAGKLADWLEATGRPLREYPDFRKLTAREISVAIGWVPWPESWPARRHRAAA